MHQSHFAMGFALINQLRRIEYEYWFATLKAISNWLRMSYLSIYQSQLCDILVKVNTRNTKRARETVPISTVNICS